VLEAWFAKFASLGMCNPADQTAVVDGEPVQAQVDADTRSLGHRQHDALAALVRGQLGDPKLGQHNGLPATVTRAGRSVFGRCVYCVGWSPCSSSSVLDTPTLAHRLSIAKPRPQAAPLRRARAHHR
jgi:Domain of unknown function (DUF222)